MEKESPVNLRKSLIMVENFKKHGIGFIPIPVLSEDHRIELLLLCDQKLEEMAQIAEGWRSCKTCECPKCDSKEVKHREDDRGDFPHKCSACGKTWCVDGPDY